jgi:hypothetical protein
VRPHILGNKPRRESIGATNCGSDCSSTAGQGIIGNNRVHGNGWDAVRGGVEVRDAQHVVVRNNIFGPATYAGLSFPRNVGNLAVRATDSGRSDRPNLYNVDIVNNTLNGETIMGCELPDAIVYCAGNAP